MKIASFLLPLLLPTLASVADATNYHWSNETMANYVPYPPELQARLNNEVTLYKSNGYPLPTMRVYQTFPEKQPRVWLLLKSITSRLHPTLWPHAHYELRDGIEFGCRTAVDDGQLNDKTGEALNWKPVTTSHCHRHCLHQGRYCLETSDNFDDHHGRAALKEIVRRLCLDNVYHAKDPRFIQYIEEYDKNDCLKTHAPRNCSHTAMIEVGFKPSDISTCVAEKDQDSDIPNDIIERNMRHVNKRRTTWENTVENQNSLLPVVSIDDEHYVHQFDGNDNPWEKLTTDAIFHKYCNAFPSSAEKPVACHICHDGCDNIRDCLWSLKCNGKTLDVAKDIPRDVLFMSATGATSEFPNAHGHTPQSPYSHHTTTTGNSGNTGPTPAPTKPNLMETLQDKPRPTPSPTPRPTSDKKPGLMDSFHDDGPSPTSKPTEEPYNGGKFDTMSALDGMGHEKEDEDPREEERESFHDGSIMGELNHKPLRKEPRPEHKASSSSSSDSYDGNEMFGMLDTGDDDDDSNDSDSTPSHVLIFWGLVFTMGPLLCGLAFAYYYSKFRSERKRKLLADIREGKYSLNGGLMRVCRDNIGGMIMANGSNPQGQQQRSPSPTATGSTGSVDDVLDINSQQSLGGRAPEENHEAVVARAEQLLKSSSAKELGLSRSSLTTEDEQVVFDPEGPTEVLPPVV